MPTKFWSKNVCVEGMSETDSSLLDGIAFTCMFKNAVCSVAVL